MKNGCMKLSMIIAPVCNEINTIEQVVKAVEDSYYNDKGIRN